MNTRSIAWYTSIVKRVRSIKVCLFESDARAFLEKRGAVFFVTIIGADEEFDVWCGRDEIAAESAHAAADELAKSGLDVRNFSFGQDDGIPREKRIVYQPETEQSRRWLRSG